MLTLLRINRKFMEYMRQYYPGAALQEPSNTTRPDDRTPQSPSE
jgi:hypothetical protein